MFLLKENEGEHLKGRVTLLTLAGVQKKIWDHFEAAQQSCLAKAKQSSSQSYSFKLY